MRTFTQTIIATALFAAVATACGLEENEVITPEGDVVLEGEASTESAVGTTPTRSGSGSTTEPTSGGSSGSGSSGGSTGGSTGTRGGGGGLRTEWRCGDSFTPEYSGGTTVTGTEDQASAAAAAMCRDTAKRSCLSCSPGLPAHLATNGIEDSDDTWSIHCDCH